MKKIIVAVAILVVSGISVSSVSADCVRQDCGYQGAISCEQANEAYRACVEAERRAEQARQSQQYGYGQNNSQDYYDSNSNKSVNNSKRGSKGSSR